jgi:hypothetical protein
MADYSLKGVAHVIIAFSKQNSFTGTRLSKTGSTNGSSRTVLSLQEVFDRIIEKSELTSLIQDLDPCKAAIVLCQISAELRLAKRDRETVGKASCHSAYSL